MKVNGHEISISDRNKVFFPEVALTKGDLIDYYDKIADVMLPLIEGYPISMQRFPDGMKGGGWYMKDVPEYFPDWMKTVTFPKKEGGSFNAPIVADRASLMYLADQAVITLHAYLAHAEDLEHPNKMAFDLDPPENMGDFKVVREAALGLRAILQELELKSWVLTTGSMGFHVIVPIEPQRGFDDVRDFANNVALILVRRHADKFTLEQRKKDRKGRVYVDTYRNAYGATSVAPCAVRARSEASIATPIDWEEIETGANPRDWTIKNIFRRLGQKDDPWQGILGVRQSLETHKDQLQDLLDKETPVDEED